MKKLFRRVNTRVLFVVLLACSLCTIFSCMEPRPLGKYPSGKEEILREHEEVHEAREREKAGW